MAQVLRSSIVCHRVQQRAIRCSTVVPRASRRDTIRLLTVLGAEAAVLAQAPSAFANALSDSFLTDTRNLANAMQTYITAEPFDKERIASGIYFKQASKKWISEHAKGGSAPGQAAKRMYVAVDAVAGHMASNGAAPLPRGKVAFVQKTLAEVEALLEQDK